MELLQLSKNRSGYTAATRIKKDAISCLDIADFCSKCIWGKTIFTQCYSLLWAEIVCVEAATREV